MPNGSWLRVQDVFFVSSKYPRFSSMPSGKDALMVKYGYRTLFCVFRMEAVLSILYRISEDFATGIPNGQRTALLNK